LYSSVKATDLSSFQENDFDLNFVVNKDVKASRVLQVIEKTSPLIRKVELLDIYENEEKLA
jgi:phenylalanyl-tRNA synthetase beta subunit